MARLKKLTEELLTKSPNHQRFKKPHHVGEHPRQDVLDARVKAHHELLEIARKRQANPDGFRKPGSLNQHK